VGLDSSDIKAEIIARDGVVWAVMPSKRFTYFIVEGLSSDSFSAIVQRLEQDSRDICSHFQ